MSKRIYFIISGIIQIITSILAIINSKELAKTLTDTLNMFGDTTEMGRLFSHGNIYIILLAIICIVLNGLIIFWAIKDKLLRHKGGVLVCSIISIFTSTYNIVMLLAIINIIVIANSKRERKEDFPPEKKPLPVIKKEEVNKDKIIKAIILLVVYFSQFIWASFLDESKYKVVISIIFYILMITLSIIFFKDLLKENYKVFKNNFKTYISNLLPLIGKYYLVYLAIAMFAVFLTDEISSANQTSIEALPIWYSFPLAVIYAPIVEEALFRGCVRRFIKNDTIFVIVSAICFGLLHTIFSEESLYNTIAMSLPYMAMGGFLAYIYTKTNNILCNMSFHCFHNTLAMLVLLLIK